MVARRQCNIKFFNRGARYFSYVRKALWKRQTMSRMWSQQTVVEERMIIARAISSTSIKSSYSLCQLPRDRRYGRQVRHCR